MTNDYSSNIRELFTFLECSSVFGETDIAKPQAEHKQMTTSLIPKTEYEHPDAFDEMLRLHVRWVYEKHGNDFTKPAEVLKALLNTV